MATPASSTLTGVVERIVFLNEENHYTIAEFRPDPSFAKTSTFAAGTLVDRPAKPGATSRDTKPGLVTVVGPLPGVECGETLHLTGEWVRHAQHGDQFKVAAFKSELPSGVYGIRKYLGSGLVPGIGKVYANKIVDVFGTDTLRVLSEESGRLRDVPGIGPKRATAIKRAWDEKRAERELYIFLQTYGVTPAQCVKLVQRYGWEAKPILMREPYRVAREIDGIGFRTADRIAINLGFANDAPPRLDAGVLYALETLQEEGHTAFPQDDLIQYTANLLETSADLLAARIEALVQSKQLVRHVPPASELSALRSPLSALLQLPLFDRAEQKIAEVVARLTRTASGLPPIKVDAAVQWAEQKAGFTFHELQRTALRSALTHKLTILTGGPGTGKAQPLSAQVLTPEGFRAIGSLRPGDQVISAEGKPVVVRGVFPQGRKPICRVTFSDGRSTTCCNDHLWKTWTRISVWSPQLKKKVRSRGWRVVPLHYIRQRLAEDRAECDRMGVPLLEPWCEQPDLPLTCDPYVIGALIGDGCLKDAVIITSVDSSLIRHLAIYLEPLGLKPVCVTLHQKPTISWRLVGGRKGRANPLRSYICELGLDVNCERKFIPEVFFRTSYRQRLQLLRGLLDTDGTVDRLGVVSFSTSSRQLADGFQRLAWSLGCIATLGAVKHPTYTYRGRKRAGRPAYTVFLQHPRPDLLFELERKRLRTLRPRARKRLSHRLRLTQIEPAGEAECVCISVDSPSGLYVTDDYIVTHNTTILRALVEILKAKKVRVHLAAPTGRAAQRLAETTGGFASTIHRLLRYDPARGGFTAHEGSPLATDFLIVDEASMLDARLAAALFQAVPVRAHLLLVGDIDQLPSVGAGHVLKDLIAVSQSKIENQKSEIPVTRLSVVYRQQGQSAIVTTAHAINGGDASLPPLMPDVASVPAWSDLTFVQADSAEDCVRKVVQLCTEFIPRHCRWFNPVGDVQVLAPMHKGAAGVSNLNLQLQAALNGHARGLRTVTGEFRPGDKVIQLRNNYDKNLFNGDIGTVRSVDADAGTLQADFDGEVHEFSRGDFGDLALAYCISIHKSQGSEYPVVIVALLKAHFVMLQRNLLYTGITRGRKKVFIVGEPAAYAMAVRNSEAKVRCTHLQQKVLRLATP